MLVLEWQSARSLKHRDFQTALLEDVVVPRRWRLNEHGYCQNVYLPRKCRNYENLKLTKKRKKNKKKTKKY